MFDNPIQTRTATAVHLFVQDHSEGIQNAALLLGGRPELRRAMRVNDDLSMAPQIASRTLRDIDALLDLLTLQHVHDEQRPEAAYFAMLDPAQPYVEEICLLADGLNKAIGEFDTSRSTQTAPGRRRAELEDL